jgi:hypothetical protein
MLNSITPSKTLQLFIAITVSILITGYLRLQLFSGMPETDGGLNTFAAQFYYNNLINGEVLKGMMPLHLYPFLTSWVYGFEVNQFVLLRLIDGLVAIVASIILFKVILKESGSTLFTVILMTALLIIMNDIEIIALGYRNSIWAAFIPLFSALLIWQNSNKEDKYSFYLIGGLVSLGILLREPFLPFFIFAGIAILISYGWRVLFKYLIGSAVVGFSLLGLILMLRGWDLISLINSYIQYGAEYVGVMDETPWAIVIKANWFIFVASFLSIFYLIKLYCTDKKLVNIRRGCFWLVLALIPLIEYNIKMGLPYHITNCLIGLVGLTSMGWNHVVNQESNQIKKSIILVIGLLSLLVILTVIDKLNLHQEQSSPADAVEWVMDPLSFRSLNMVRDSQYIKVAAKVYSLSREDSTLVVSGFWQTLYPLTELLPQRYELSSLRGAYINVGFDESKLMKIISKYRPSLIVTSTKPMTGEAALPNIIEKTNLYNKVAFVPNDPNLDKNGGGPGGAIIYRLKDF